MQETILPSLVNDGKIGGITLHLAPGCYGSGLFRVEKLPAPGGIICP